MTLKQSLITEALGEFNNEYGDYHLCLEGNGVVPIYVEQDIKKLISDIVAHTVDKTVEGIKSGIEGSFRGCACGLHGYQVLPDCDKEKHDIKSCADCYLNSLTDEKHEQKGK